MGVTLTVAIEERDLGVIINEEVKFHNHVGTAVKESSMMLLLIRATCLDEVTVLRLFTTLVRPHLEYGNIIWSSCSKMDSVEVDLRHLPYRDPSGRGH